MIAVGQDARLAVTDLVYREVRLLDEAQFPAWLGLYTVDATYWVPSGLPPYDHQRKISIIYDDRAALEARVTRLASKFAFAQAPPSRTVRVVTNLEVEPRDDAGYRVRCVYIVHELRMHRERVLPARAVYELVKGDDDLRIRHKRLDLLASDEPLEEIGFIL
jgi:3-phenylpropionate/cinnamic acid dioxygenase small subunit